MALGGSASVSQVTTIARSSSFARSSSRARSLRSCPEFAFFAVSSNGSMVMAMATKRGAPKTSCTSKKTSWFPGLKFGSLANPKWLDASILGRNWFNLLGLGEAEIIRGRWAMAGVVGILFGQAWSAVPWFEAGVHPSAVSPSFFGTLFGTQLLLMGWIESKRWVKFLEPGPQLVDWVTPRSRTAENFGDATGLQGYPGGKFFDPWALAGEVKGGNYVTDYAKLKQAVLGGLDAKVGKELLIQDRDDTGTWRVSAYGDQLPNQAETVAGSTTIQAEFKSLPDLDYLQELLAIQQSGPRAIGFFGTRNMGFMHQQLIEILSYAMVITKNHIYTSGAAGTNAAVIRGALRAEMPESLTVILPQSLKKQPPESQDLLSKVKNVIEMPHNDHLPLLEASRLCNMDILSHVQQVICFAFHDSNLLMETCREAKNLRKIVTLFYLD